MKYLYVAPLIGLMMVGCQSRVVVQSPSPQEVQTVVMGQTNTAVRKLPKKREVIFRATQETNDSFGGVCDFDAPVSLTQLAASGDGFVDVPPTHPSIFYMGRIDCDSEEAPFFAFPGVNIRVRFTGSAIDIKMKDYASPSNAQTDNYYDVVIDNNPPILLKLSTHQTVYQVARDLPSGEHLLSIFKRSESSHYDYMNVGRADFLGVRIPAGESLLSVKARKNRIEFIGDSITCGYGNEISTENPDAHSFTTRHSNAHLAWGAVAAEMMDAEYMVVAASGKGMVRNYGGAEGATIPDMYERCLPDDDSAVSWDARRYTPGIVVINLGTNDYSDGMTAAEAKALHQKYQDTYLEFMGRIRTQYPKADIILAAGPMMSDFFPTEYRAWTMVREAIGNVIAARKAAGDTRVHQLFFSPQSAPYGQDWHPTVDTHHQMAEQLVAFIEAHLTQR